MAGERKEGFKNFRVVLGFPTSAREISFLFLQQSDRQFIGKREMYRGGGQMRIGVEKRARS